MLLKKEFNAKIKSFDFLCDQNFEKKENYRKIFETYSKTKKGLFKINRKDRMSFPSSQVIMCLFFHSAQNKWQCARPL